MADSKTTKNQELIPIEDLAKRMTGFSTNYFLVDVHRDKESFYALWPEIIHKTPSKDFFYTIPEEYLICFCGIILNLIMDGELEKSQELLEALPQEGHFPFYKMGLVLVHPKVTYRQFIDILKYLKKINFQIKNVVLTASRPSILNGFNDFSRIGPFLKNKKEEFIDYLSHLYDKAICPAIYDLCLAEWLYLQNKLIDAEVIVSRLFDEFNKAWEHRLYYVAAALQSKILIALGKTIQPDAYIKDIRKSIKELGHAEFSYNIGAAEILCAMYTGNTKAIQSWLENGAPDEYSDFNMLDTFRYMIKIRSYIIVKNHAAAIALVEKLRPLLEAGKRWMDLCELDLLNAIALFRADKKEVAFKALSRSLKIVHRRKYIRLIADEGEAILPLINAFIKEKGLDSFGKDFFENIITPARALAVNYPLYLKPVKNETILSDTETEILRFLERGKTADEIAEYFLISRNTVKYHLKNLYTKLDVTNATGAVWEAKVQGIL